MNDPTREKVRTSGVVGQKSVFLRESQSNSIVLTPCIPQGDTVVNSIAVTEASMSMWWTDAESSVMKPDFCISESGRRLSGGKHLSAHEILGQNTRTQMTMVREMHCKSVLDHIVSPAKFTILNQVHFDNAAHRLSRFIYICGDVEQRTLFRYRRKRVVIVLVLGVLRACWAGSITTLLLLKYRSWLPDDKMKEQTAHQIRSRETTPIATRNSYPSRCDKS